MKPLLIVAIVALVGCRTPPIACDAHLTPINPVTRPASGTTSNTRAPVPPATAQPGAPAQPLAVVQPPAAVQPPQGSGR